MILYTLYPWHYAWPIQRKSLLWTKLIVFLSCDMFTCLQNVARFHLPYQRAYFSHQTCQISCTGPTSSDKAGIDEETICCECVLTRRTGLQILVGVRICTFHGHWFSKEQTSLSYHRHAGCLRATAVRACKWVFMECVIHSKHSSSWISKQMKRQIGFLHLLVPCTQ